MKIFSFLILILFSFTISAQEIDFAKYIIDIETFKVDSVVFYNFDYKKTESIIIGYRFPENRKNKFKLEGNKANKFIGLLKDTNSFGLGTMACFEPHIGVLLYKNGNVNAFIDICLDWNRLNASFKINAQQNGAVKLEDGSIFLLKNGMSKSFRRYLNELIKPHDFSHQLDYQSELDK